MTIVILTFTSKVLLLLTPPAYMEAMIAMASDFWNMVISSETKSL